MDKVILKQAIVDTFDQNWWDVNPDPYADEGSELDEANAQRECFADLAIKRYFELLRIEFAKDGN